MSLYAFRLKMKIAPRHRKSMYMFVKFKFVVTFRIVAFTNAALGGYCSHLCLISCKGETKKTSMFALLNTWSVSISIMVIVHQSLGSDFLSFPWRTKWRCAIKKFSVKTKPPDH